MAFSTALVWAAVCVSTAFKSRSEEHTSELQSLRPFVCRRPRRSTLFPYTTLFRSHIIANLGFYLLNGFLDGVGLGGRVRIHSLQIQGHLGVDLSQAPVHLPDVLGQTGFQRHNHLLKYAPVQSVAELHEGVFVNLCVVFHSSQPFRQGTKVCHFILPRFRGSLCEFHRHAEQETIAKCQRETLEERGLTGLLHKT